MGKLLDLLRNVPVNFLFYVLGAFVTLSSTLLGIHLTNRANDRRQERQLAQDRELKERQLEHDRELKNRDREMLMRKEIYLAATEAIHAALTAISRFAQLEIPNDKLTEDYLARSSAMAKVHIVAKDSTIRVLLQFSGEVAATFPRLISKRQPLLQRMKEIAFLNDLEKRYTDQQSQMVELMTQHNLEGSSDERRFALLQSNFEFDKQKIGECSAKRNDLGSRLQLDLLEFMKECSEEAMRLWRLSVPVVVAVRQELDLPLDESEYGNTVEATIEKMRETMKAFTKQAPGSGGVTPTEA